MYLIFIDTGGAGESGCFVVWKCEVAWLDGLVGVRFLLSAVIGSVLIAMSCVVLSAYFLGRSGFFC